MPAPTGLDAGLFIGAGDPLVGSQGSTVPVALVEIKDAARLGQEVGVTGEDPTPMVPRPDGIFRQPAPDGCLSDRGHNPPFDGGPLQLRLAETRQGDPLFMGKLTGQGLDRDDGGGGKSSPAGRGEERLRAPRGLGRRSAPASCKGRGACPSCNAKAKGSYCTS